MGNFTILKRVNSLTLRIFSGLFLLVLSLSGLQARPAEAGFSGMDRELIKGTVKDETGSPLPGAAVLVKGTNTGTITDLEGNFSVDVKSDAILVISYLGYTPKEVSVAGQSFLTIQLEPESSQLNEIVVVGYGTQKRSDVTGAIGSVKRESFNKGVITNPVDLLQGKVAGVNITSTSGEPGANQNVIIRGIGSLRSGTQPLYVLDGFLLDNSDTGIASNPLISVFGG